MDRQTLKRTIPGPIWRVGSATYWWWRNRGQYLGDQLVRPEWRDSQRRLRPYANLYRGRRAFIIGNGPSLRNTDLTKLKNEITFGLNRIYLAFPDLGFSTSYLVSVNDLVMEQCADDMRQLSIPKFITWRARRWMSGDPGTIFLDTDYTGSENFSGDATGRLFEGFTVTYVALQLAFYMGFDEIILLGVDHNFQTKGPANQVVTSQGEDPNHFSPSYFGKGFRWQLPDLDGSERAYRMARTAYEKAGRRVLDATVGGKLTVFPKVNYLDLFS